MALCVDAQAFARSLGNPLRPLSRRPNAKKPGKIPGVSLQEREEAYCPSDFTIDSTVFFASPKSIIVLGLKNSSFSTPA